MTFLKPGLGIFVFVCTGIMLAAVSLGVVLQEGKPADQEKEAQKLMAAGNFKQAAAIFGKLSTDPKVDSALAAKSLASLVQCQISINLADQMDASLAAAVKARPNDWRVLKTASHLVLSTLPYGTIVNSQFIRGYGNRVGGIHVSTVEQDRLQSLKWCLSAIASAKADGIAEDSREMSELYQQLANALVTGRNSQFAWQLQSLTDVGAVPDYLDRDAPQNSVARFAPASEDGSPVLYAVPESWETAVSDGQRYRFAIERLRLHKPNDAVGLETWANFLISQFDVSTMQQDLWLFQSKMGNDKDDARASIVAVHTLAEDETIAKLATGIHRFKLADEYNPIRHYQQLSKNDNRDTAERSLNALHQIFLNRRQYVKAAEMLNQSIERFGDDSQSSKRKAIDNITKGRFAFDPVEPQVVGQPAEVSFLYRNAKAVQFRAWVVDVEKILADTKKNIKDARGNRYPGMQGSLESPGEYFSGNKLDRYLKGQPVDWNLALEPRPGHWDRRIKVKTPLEKAGLYLIEARDEASGFKARCMLWIQDTVIVRKTGDGENLLFTVDAVTGKPLADMNIEFFGYRYVNKPDGSGMYESKSFAVKSDKQGIAKSNLLNDYAWFTAARSKDGRLGLMGFEYFWASAYFWPSYQEVKAYGISDRPLYRPGETVRTKFWFANTGYGDEPGQRLANATVTITMHNAQGVAIASRELTTDRFGACDTEFELPKTVGLGHFYFTAQNANQGNCTSSLSIRVEEYRKPEFEVKVLAPTQPVGLGETIEARIQAKYYFGTPVTDAEVTVRVQRSTYRDTFYPLGRFDWCYGPGYWWFAEDYSWYPSFKSWCCCLPVRPVWWGGGYDPPELVLDQQVKLDASGEAIIKIDTAIAKQLFGDEDHRYTLDVEVRDASRRTITASGSVFAARQPFKVYAWVDRGFYNVGDKVQASFTARTLDGTSVAASGTVDLLKITYTENKPQERVVATFPAQSNADGEFKQVLQATETGQYRIRARMKDKAGHEVEGGYIFTVRGRGSKGENFHYNALELTPDKREYVPGETVKLQVAANRNDALVYLFLRPSNSAYQLPVIVQLQNKSTVVDIPVKATDQPNFFVEAFTIYDGECHQSTREIIVPPTGRELKVELTADKTEYLPGEEANVKLLVTDPDGRPVVGSCLIAAYDQSLDQIASDVLPRDIREFFWKWRRQHTPFQRTNIDSPTYPIQIKGVLPMTPLGIFGETLADDAELSQEPKLALRKSKNSRMRGRMMPGGMGMGMGDMGMGGGMMEMSAAMNEGGVMGGFGGMMGGGGMMAAPMAADSRAFAKSGAGAGYGDGQVAEPLVVRKNFADSALWLASLTTNDKGQAEAKFKMPDNLTRWKIGSWAVSDKIAVGSDSTEAVTRRNLMVRLQTPRFLVQGDEVVLSAIVDNDFPTDQQVKVKIEIDGETQLERMPDVAFEQTCMVKSHQQQRIDWRCKAIAEGEVKLRVSAISPDASDAVQQSIPIIVRGFLKTDSFAGTVRGDKNAAKVAIKIPADRRADQSQLVVRVSPTLAASMIDALPYLAEYPYGCTEQTLNRFLPTVITQRTLQAMKVDLATLNQQRNNLNAQELGAPAVRSARWKKFDRNPVYDQAVVDDMVQTGVNRLTNMQNDDGGWGWFSGTGAISTVHTTATVVRGLLVAQQNNVAIVPDVLQRGVAWLEQHQNSELEQLKNFAEKRDSSKHHVDNTTALVFHVLCLADRSNPEMQQFLFDQREHLSVYGKSLFAWAAHQLGNAEQTKMLRQNIEQFLVEDAENETAYLRDDTAWWYWYGSQIEATAMYLKLLSAQDPQGQVAPRLIKYLLNNRKHATYWNSTRDTALVVEAFADYLKATDELQANVTAEVYLGGKRVGRVEFTPENLFSVDNTIAIGGDAIPGGTHELEIRRVGKGPIYWNAYVTNFTMEKRIEPAGLEVKIQRRYFLLKPDTRKLNLPGKTANVIETKKSGFERTEIKDLQSVKSGELVEVELTVDSKNDYEYLLIEDNKPACLESVDAQSGYFYSGGLSIYRELRDKKVGLCIQWLPRGTYSISYQLRSEAPGKFSALPAKIEGMYAPELVGNSANFDWQVSD